MLYTTRIVIVLLIAALSICAAPGIAAAAPQLSDPSVGSLELVTLSAEDRAKLNRIDGLAFDSFGNLFGAVENSGVQGGVVYIDKFTGAVTRLVFGISRADQIALHPDGDLLVTSEVTPASTSNRLFRVAVEYDEAGIPVSAIRSSIATSQAINNPEGLVVLQEDGDFGLRGDAIVAEDRSPGRIARVALDSGTLIFLAAALRRPEGLALGDFAGMSEEALYAAETSDDNVLRIDANRVVTVFGNPAAVALRRPDNVEFGPDGFLYVSEDRSVPNSRILRVAADGTHSVFATGFGQAAGMVFDPESGDLYIAEQDFDRIWRVRFNPDAVAIEDLRLRGSALEIVCTFCTRAVDDALEEGDFKLRSLHLGEGTDGGGQLWAEVELEFGSGEELELECDGFASLRYDRELRIAGAECRLSEGGATIDACSRFVVRPAGGTWDVLIEPSACDVAVGSEMLRISGALERFEVRYEDPDD